MAIGAIGSPAHVLTNEKIEGKDKAVVLGKMMKEDIKDTLTLGGIAVGAGAAATVATSFSAKAANAFKQGMNGVLKQLGRVKVDNKSLLAKLKNSSIFKSFNALPTQAKAGIAAAVAAAAIALPFINNIDVAKKGHIEGKAENNDANAAQPKKKKPISVLLATAAFGLPGFIVAKSAEKAEKAKAEAEVAKEAEKTEEKAE